MKKQKKHLLVCDDEESVRLALKAFLSKDFTVHLSQNCDEALEILKKQSIEMLLLDVNLRWEGEGLEYMPKILALDPALSILMISARREFEVVREAMRQGASDYIDKDSDPQEWLLNLDRAFERRRLFLQSQLSNRELAERDDKEKELIGEDPKIESLRRLIKKVRVSDANVVIFGETGCGKEVVARHLRACDGKGVLKPFVAVDSSTVQSHMAESLLFGHEQGAFTGATEQRKGAFEAADGGTIYFDEISNMSLEIQQKLLRVLQEKEICRLGSNKVISLEFRVVCATNKPLEWLVKEGKFLEDLYQRLNVIPLTVPPLRDRKQDIPLLLDFFLEKNSKNGTEISFSKEAIKALVEYKWPGNIRELQNLVAYLAVVSDVEEIGLDDLPPKFSEGYVDDKPYGETFYEKVSQYEKEILQAEYREYGGNVSLMAKKLKMDRSHLYTKLKLYGIHSAKNASSSDNVKISASNA